MGEAWGAFLAKLEMREEVMTSLQTFHLYL